MPRRNLIIAPCHNVRVQPQAAGVSASIFLPEFFEYRKVIQVDAKAEVYAFHNLAEVNAIGSELNFFLFKTGTQCQLRFVDRNCINTSTVFL